MKHPYEKLNEDFYFVPVKDIDNAVEVYTIADSGAGWFDKWSDKKSLTHKGLLIRIEPINKKTREEKLEKIVRSYLSHQEHTHGYSGKKHLDELNERAKQALEQEE